ncbi:MAG: hypothetical protein SF162_02625 [bacterium]|nr:hypothetical protein [bacterium]
MRIGLMLALVLTATVAAAQDDSVLTVGCQNRPNPLSQPWITLLSACLEEAVFDRTLGVMAFASITVGDDGTLYAANPLTGDILALTDTDADLLPDAPRVIISGLHQASGLAVDNGDLYIAAAESIYRWRNGELETLVDDLPSGAGYWTGGLIVANDRLYVATGAPCSACAAGDPARGAVLSFTRDGVDRRIEMTGLVQPRDLAMIDDRLYVVDSAADRLISDGLRVDFPAESHPLGMVYYEADALEPNRGHLLVVLSGSTHAINLSGYAVVRIDPFTGAAADVMPAQPVPGEANSDFTREEMNLRESGFFPERPLDVAVSPEGWIYISMTDGRIIAMRPYTL